MKSGFSDATINLVELKTLLEISGELFCTWDENGCLQPLNSAWEQVLGWSLVELRARPWKEFVHPEDVAATRKIGCCREKAIAFEQRVRHKNGTYRILVWRICRSPQRNTCGVARDVTEQRQLEMRYRMTCELSSDYVFMANITPDGQILVEWVTEAFDRITGYTLSELNSRGGWSKIIYYKDLPKLTHCFQKLLNNESVTSKYRIVTKQGELRWVSDSVHPVWDETQQRVVAVFGATRDITEQQQALEALHRSQELYRTLAQNFPDGAVVLFDKNCRYLIAEGKGLAAVGLSREMMEGKTNREIFPKQICKTLDPIYQAALAGETTVSEIFYANQYYCIQALPVKNDRGEIFAGMVVATNITKRKQAEAAVQTANERERLMASVCDRIRDSLDLNKILNTTVAQVRNFLHVDRVLIYRFQENWNGTVAVESVSKHTFSLLGTNLTVSDLAKNCIPYYQHGRIFAVEDIYTANLAKHHLEFLEQLQVRSLLVVPILKKNIEGVWNDESLDNHSSHKRISEVLLEKTPLPPAPQSQLWGLLVAHHSNTPRKWQSLEIDLLKELASQLAIAIQQAELYQQLAMANRELQRLAACDYLTQVANRRRFDEYLEQEWHRQARERKPISLLLCDIDFFKFYNDTYGHLKGDECLQQVAAAISRSVKRPANLVARYGGEEFAVILPNTNSQEALCVAQAIQLAVKALKIPHAGSSVSDFVSLSIGIATQEPTPNSNASQLIAAADEALYRAKANGRDRLSL
ncbi:MAG: diguanylate cyclase [Oscillatoriaceae bacterium SKW80]|nr:diguanylate cyclase [Oscillatoriaceae bacterium SKYG93]MCX8119917.1 diguanylate cyclase [Oscillatoriaceae bacterium SKW80]MDW8451850.1 diguanylate cyclase [Oscillatoriaceae cyanobacterium SKYGB_i_bin93]HIK27582.1 diguanylate cyclase [Oscillatoriaceae cyanobacterium M7585_C2015_266]